MFQSGKLAPPSLDQRTTKSLNLTVLQRMDPYVAEILMTAAHVAFYEFDIDVNQWSRKDVEGTLFVVKRNAQPRFQFIVMNRRNTDNLVEDLLGDFEYEVQVPYILYRNEAHEVIGIWFYKSQDCEAVANLLSRILHAYSKVLPKPKLCPIKSEFQELEAAADQEIIENPLEPSVSSSAASVTDPPDESFLSFSNAAMNVGSMLNLTSGGQPPLTSPSIPLIPHASMTPSASPTAASATAFSTSSSLIPTLDTCGSTTGNNNHGTNLLKPMYLFPTPISSAFAMPPISSCIHSAPPLLRPVTMQQQYDTQLFQSFPPPAPAATLNPTPDYVPVITREGIRNAMMRLVQNDDFIEMVYGEVVNAQIS